MKIVTNKTTRPVAWKLFEIITLIAVVFLIAFKSAPETNKAEVNQVNGLFIFSDSKPIAKYTYIGTIRNNGISLNPKYTNVRDKMINKLKEKYPEANGVILFLN